MGKNVATGINPIKKIQPGVKQGFIFSQMSIQLSDQTTELSVLVRVSTYQQPPVTRVPRPKVGLFNIPLDDMTKV